jgi:hypothetical protein
MTKQDEYLPCTVCGETEADSDGFCPQCELPMDKYSRKMTKQRKSKPKDPRKDAEYRAVHRMDAAYLAEQMAAVATMMWTVAERMEFFAGFNPKMRGRAVRLAEVAAVVRTWCSEVRGQSNKQKESK